MESVDPAYAGSDSAGFAMDWKTFLSIIHSVLTIGEAESAAYLLRKDDRGLYTLYGQPVFISPSLDDIGVLKVPFLYGDWSRFIIPPC